MHDRAPLTGWTDYRNDGALKCCSNAEDKRREPSVEKYLSSALPSGWWVQSSGPKLIKAAAPLLLFGNFGVKLIPVAIPGHPGLFSRKEKELTGSQRGFLSSNERMKAHTVSQYFS